METYLAHPPKDPLVIIRQWQLEFCNGNHCAAAILSMFEMMVRNVIQSDFFLTAEKIKKNILDIFSISIIKEALLYLAQRKLLYITEYNSEEAKKIMLSNKHAQIIDIESLPRCAWCKCKTFILHAHHYPVPAIKGGLDTIDICPNCHSEHHFLTDNKFYASKPILREEFNKHPLSETEVYQLHEILVEGQNAKITTRC